MKQAGAFLFLLLAVLIMASPGAAWAASADTAAVMDEQLPDVHADGQQASAADHHNAEGAKKGLPQFDPSTYASQAFWLAIAFCVLYVVFSKKTLPEIGAVLQTREAHIQDNLDAAEAMKGKADAARQSYEAALQKSQAESAAMFAKIDQDMKTQMASDLEKFQARSALQIAETETALDKARQGAMDDIQSVAAEIASMAAEKIVGISADLGQAQTAVRKIRKAA